MPTPARIHDLLSRGDHERLLRETVSRETPLPLSARLILHDGAGVAPLMEALALVRVVDAGYRPSRQAIELASRVVEEARGALDAPVWDDTDDHTWALRAASLVALEAWHARLGLLTKLGVTTDLPTPLRVTLLWLRTERAPESLDAPIDRLRDRLDEAGAAHDPALAELFLVGARRRDRARIQAPAAPIFAA